MIHFDEHLFPIMIQDWSETVRDEDLRDYCVRQARVVERVIAKDTPYVMVTTAASDINARQRKMLTEWIKTLPASWDDYVIASYAVVPSAAQRGVLTALKWLMPSLAKIVFVNSMDAAMSRARASLARAGIRLPDELSTLAQSA